MKPCSTHNCRRKAQEGRSICRPCRTIKERESDLAKYCWQNHKKNCKRRNIETTLTLDEYREFAVRTGYIAKKGRYKFSLHMDRREEDKGYHIWNIQALPNSVNVAKYLDYKWGGNRMEFHMRTSKINVEQQAGDPF